MPSATKIDLTILRGVAEILDFIYLDDAGAAVDLTGYSAQMQIRAYREATGDPLAEYTSGGGEITLNAGAVTGRVLVEADTTAYAFSRGVYDLKLFPPGAAAHEGLRVRQGKVRVDWDVTR